MAARVRTQAEAAGGFHVRLRVLNPLECADGSGRDLLTCSSRRPFVSATACVANLPDKQVKPPELPVKKSTAQFFTLRF